VALVPDLFIVPLADGHDRSGFTCGVESPDRYFQTQAGQDVRRRANGVFVLAGKADPARVLGTSLGHLQDSVGHLAVGGVADLCVLSSEGHWLVSETTLRSQGKSTPFSGYELPGRVRVTGVGGQVAFEAR